MTNTAILVYVVDDELFVRQIVKDVLERNGFRVRTFSDPMQSETALRAEGEKPALLIADFDMQPFTGCELIQRAVEISPNLKTIMISGNSSAKSGSCNGTRPDVFLEKPFELDELKDCISRLLTERKAL